jgi:hypothetical protein
MIGHRAVPQDGPGIAGPRACAWWRALLAAATLAIGLVPHTARAAPNDYDGDWAMNLNCTANTVTGWAPLSMNIAITLRAGVGEVVRTGANPLGGRDTNRWSYRVTGNVITIRNDASANDGRTWVYRISGTAAGPTRFSLTGGNYTTSGNTLMRTCEGSLVSVAPAPASLAATGGGRVQTADRTPPQQTVRGTGGAATAPPPPAAATPAPRPAATPARPAATPQQPAAAAPAAAALAAVAATPPVATAPRAPAPAIDGRRVALVIGNGDYTHGTPLRNPVNDARRMAEVLERAGFEVVVGLDLDRRGMETKVREFGNRLEGGRVGLFFYAGHAMQVAGENYLLPVDAVLERERDLAFETVSLGQVLRAMESSAATNLVFLDACRDNPLTRSFQRSLGTRSAAVGQGLAQVQSGLGTLVAYATQPGNVALDGRDANSPFTSALAQHLVTPGIDIAIAMRRVRESVVAATGGRQVPWDHSSLTGDVVLVGAPSAAPAPAPVALAAPAAEPAGGIVRGGGGGGADREVVFWQSAVAGGQPADFEAYLRAYPEGTFAPLARSRLGR